MVQREADLRTGEIVAHDSGLPTRWHSETDPDDPNEEEAPSDPDEQDERTGSGPRFG